jgi:glycosyltransferase involved in cell wall biosynthesis
MLPFEHDQAQLYPRLSLTRIRLKLLRRAQIRSFQQATAVGFLTEYARDTILPFLKPTPKRVALIPHGLDERFFGPDRDHRTLEDCTRDAPFRLLYVSIIDVYKHQIPICEAVGQLHRQGISVQLELIGPAYGPALQQLQAALQRLDPTGTFLHYSGPVPFDQLHKAYREADGFVFGSSCENLPNILLEAMASGLPICCYHKQPMPEVLGDAGRTFATLTPEDIATCLREVIDDPGLRESLGERATERARRYSWERCAQETFTVLREIASG